MNDSQQEQVTLHILVVDAIQVLRLSSPTNLLGYFPFQVERCQVGVSRLPGKEKSSRVEDKIQLKLKLNQDYADRVNVVVKVLSRLCLGLWLRTLGT